MKDLLQPPVKHPPSPGYLHYTQLQVTYEGLLQIRLTLLTLMFATQNIRDNGKFKLALLTTIFAMDNSRYRITLLTIMFVIDNGRF